MRVITTTFNNNFSPGLRGHFARKESKTCFKTIHINRNFSLHHCVQNGPGSTQPLIQWVPGAAGA